MTMNRPSAIKQLPDRPVAGHVTSRWQGRVEGLHGAMLYGWAVDCTDPMARVVVEICFNGEPVGCVVADVARSDIPGCRLIDDCHGFVADLSALVKGHSGAKNATQNATLTARIANLNCLLDGSVDLHQSALPPRAALNFVFGDGGLRLTGWAIDAQDDARSVKVYAFLGADVIAVAHANLAHPALRSYDVGQHGFSLALPLTLADGRAHQVRVVDEQGHVLNGSPIDVCHYAGGGAALMQAGQSRVGTDAWQTQERMAPRSLGLEYYADWREMFENGQGSGQESGQFDGKRTLPQRVAIIITGDGDQNATLASLSSQTEVTCLPFAVKKGRRAALSFSNLLQQALSADANVDHIACVRAGDTLPSHALRCALAGFGLPQTSVVYTDSESVCAPWFKPAWNPEYAFATDYPLELMLIKKEVIAACLAGGDAPADPAALAWCVLSAVWPQAMQAVVHVPRVLYRFNSALSPDERQMRLIAAQAALWRQEPKATLQPMPRAMLPVVTQVLPTSLPPLPFDFSPRILHRPLTAKARKTSVSLIIPTRDQAGMLARCIDSILRFTDWPDLEIIVADNDSIEPKTKTYFKKLDKQGIRVLPTPGPFNFARINNLAVAAARGQVIGMINNDIEALHSGWLQEILSHLLQPGVGAVGAKLLWPNGMVQHGGVVMGTGHVAGHYGNLLAESDWGDHGRNQLTHQVSGVTAACLFLRKADYLAVGGMDPIAFPVAFNDVDLCLKLRAQGKTIIWTPNARLLHAESASRGSEDTPQKRARAAREVAQLRQRWGAVLGNDPAYHPSLNLDPHSQAFSGLALPPRNRAPRQAGLVYDDYT